MFVQSALVGLSLPKAIWRDSLANNIPNIDKVSKEECEIHWEENTFYATITCLLDLVEEF